MAIDMDAVHARISQNYRGDEPPPSPALRRLIQARGRRLGSAPPDDCINPPQCFDPYIMRFYYQQQFVAAGGFQYSTGFATNASRRSRHYLGQLQGPARVTMIGAHGTASGALNCALNVQLCSEEYPDFDNSTDTDPVPGPWIVQSLQLIRGLPGINLLWLATGLFLPVNVPVPKGTHHLHAWHSTSANQTFHHVVVLTVPILCSEYIPPNLPEQGPPGEAPGLGYRIQYFAGTFNLATQHLSKYWHDVQGHWVLEWGYGGGDFGYLPEWTAHLPPDTFMPRVPKRLAAFPGEQVITPISEWAYVQEATA